jgi:hypothetical protein
VSSTTDGRAGSATPFTVHRSKLSYRRMNFLFPHVRAELLIHTILNRQWDDDAWPL